VALSEHGTRSPLTARANVNRLSGPLALTQHTLTPGGKTSVHTIDVAYVGRGPHEKLVTYIAGPIVGDG